MLQNAFGIGGGNREPGRSVWFAAIFGPITSLMRFWARNYNEKIAVIISWSLMVAAGSSPHVIYIICGGYHEK